MPKEMDRPQPRWLAMSTLGVSRERCKGAIRHLRRVSSALRVRAPRTREPQGIELTASRGRSSQKKPLKHQHDLNHSHRTPRDEALLPTPAGRRGGKESVPATLTAGQIIRRVCRKQIMYYHYIALAICRRWNDNPIVLVLLPTCKLSNPKASEIHLDYHLSRPV